MDKKTTDNSGVIYRISIIGILSLIAVYIITMISRPIISPEIGVAFLMLDDVRNIHQVFDKFTEFHEVWYRPFTFYLTNFFVFRLIDMHNIGMIKIISLLVIFFNGFIVTELAKKIFNSNFIERSIIFALVISHPAYYSMTYEGQGIVDPIFSIFINIALISFIALLESYNNKVGAKSVGLLAMSNASKITLVILCCLSISISILSQERALSIFPMIGLLYVFYNSKHILSKKLVFDKSVWAVLIFSLGIFILYMIFVYSNKTSFSGEIYRNSFETKYVIINIIRAVQAPFRLSFYRSNLGIYDVHHGLLFNILPIIFIVVSIFYIKNIFSGKNSEEKNGLKIIAILFFCSLPIPILFGGRSAWHYFPAGIYVSIIMGRSINYYFTKIDSKYIQSSILALFFIFLSVASVDGMHKETSGGWRSALLLIDSSLKSKALNDVEYTPKVVYYDTGSWGSFVWPFGGNGNLFKYLYKDKNIVEIAISNGGVVDSSRHLCAGVSGKEKTLYFGFDVEKISWRVIEGKNYCKITQSK